MVGDAMTPSLADMLFGCWHSNYSFPLTTTTRRTYVACLDCGAEFAYDIAAMKVGERIRRHVTHVPSAWDEQRDGLLLERLTRMVQVAEARAKDK